MIILLNAVEEGEQGWLGMNNDLEVDTEAPYVVDVASSRPNGKFRFVVQSRKAKSANRLRAAQTQLTPHKTVVCTYDSFK